MRKVEDTGARDLTGRGLLQSADVLLMHTRHSPRARLIRRSIHSYWNHALMIQVVRGPGQGSDQTLIIDPKMSGLTVEDVAYYLQEPELYDVAVKRFEKEWFHSANAGPSCCEEVLDLALKKAGEHRDSGRRWRAVVRFTRQIKLLFPRSHETAPGTGATGPQKPLDVTAYTCSGFVQWCYYQGVARVLERSGLDQSRLREVIFNPRLGARTPAEYDLLATTPGDLADSERLSWKYVIKDGVAWEVSSGDEARLITNSHRRDAEG